MRQKEHPISRTSGRPEATEDVMSEEVPRPPDEAEAEGAESLWATKHYKLTNWQCQSVNLIANTRGD